MKPCRWVGTRRRRRHQQPRRQPSSRGAHGVLCASTPRAAQTLELPKTAATVEVLRRH